MQGVRLDGVSFFPLVDSRVQEGAVPPSVAQKDEGFVGGDARVVHQRVHRVVVLPARRIPQPEDVFADEPPADVPRGQRVHSRRRGPRRGVRPGVVRGGGRVGVLGNGVVIALGGGDRKWWFRGGIRKRRTRNVPFVHRTGSERSGIRRSFRFGTDRAMARVLHHPGGFGGVVVATRRGDIRSGFRGGARVFERRCVGVHRKLAEIHHRFRRREQRTSQ
mmetsp:Transcript_2247/g.6011  ORF Transcript_2247/g.6011 Transcript_2247/m.6011 type:complete len:219 (-) Transcript_2247:301-957(-)